MSASQDKSQRFKFVYSNMYKIYKSGQSHELIGPVAVAKTQHPAVEKLQQNLKDLDRLHAELVKMLDELEKLVK